MQFFIGLLTLVNAAQFQFYATPKADTMKSSKDFLSLLRVTFAQPVPVPAAVVDPTPHLEAPLTDGAREDFVGKCQSVVTVQYEEYLPIKAVRMMCEETDLRAECVEHADSLVNAFRTNRDYAKWCDGFYGWFKEKYGENCPEQCDKFMCVKKCEWLKWVSNLDAAEADLIKDTERNIEAGHEVRAMESEVQEAEFELKATAFKHNQTRDELKYREKDLVEEDARLGASVSKTREAKEKAAHRDAITANVTAEKVAAEERQVQLGFALDERSVAKDGAKGELSRLESIAESDGADMMRLLGQAEHATDKVDALEAKIAEEKATTNQTNGTIQTDRAPLLAKMANNQAEVDEQKERMDEFNRKNTPDNDTQLRMLKVEMETTTGKGDKLVKELAEIAKRETEMNNFAHKSTFTLKELGYAEDAELEVMAKASATNETLNASQGEVLIGKAELGDREAEVAALTASRTELAENISKIEKWLKTATITGEFAHTALRENQEEEASDLKRVQAAEEKVRLADEAMTAKAIQEAKESEQLDELDDQLNRTTHDWDVATNVTNDARAALKAERDLANSRDISVWP